jgi:hypothetical protein
MRNVAHRLFLLLLVATLSTASLFAQGFNPGCKLPFYTIKTEGLDIDATCSIDGNSTDTGKRLESNAKNNFCAKGKPRPITFAIFKRLQAAAYKKEGLKAALKESRAELEDIITLSDGSSIGEGNLVRFVGWIYDARNSNVGKKKPPRKSGELVNCNQPDKESNDIHIELMSSANDDDPCNGVTAEMSPHFRPEAWSSLVDMQIERPVRITGSLFFDSSHHPCRDGQRASPARVSVWEVHPLYQIEVCKNKTITKCKVGLDSQWIPLDQWESEEEEAGQSGQMTWLRSNYQFNLHHRGLLSQLVFGI